MCCRIRHEPFLPHRRVCFIASPTPCPRRLPKSLLFYALSSPSRSAVKAERRAVRIQSFVRMRVVYVSLPACLPGYRDIFYIHTHPANDQVVMEEGMSPPSYVHAADAVAREPSYSPSACGLRTLAGKLVDALYFQGVGLGPFGTCGRGFVFNSLCIGDGLQYARLAHHQTTTRAHPGFSLLKPTT